MRADQCVTWALGTVVRTFAGLGPQPTDGANRIQSQSAGTGLIF